MKRILSYLFIPLFLIALSACSASHIPDYSYYYKNRELPEPSAESIPHCHNYGCQLVQNITLNDDQWAKIESHLKPAAKTPEGERKQIEEAIGEFERIIGPIAGTQDDRRGTFKKTGRWQLDCVDESTNTTSYLVALKQRGHLKHHEIEGPSSRFLINGRPGWPHQTAVIREKDSGARYAIDSWFRDNGYNALSVPLGVWSKGWLPPDDLRPEILEESR